MNLLQDEAFGLWEEYWGSLYPPQSVSHKVIDHIMHNYYLVNLVDNNFPEPSILWRVCKEMLEEEDKLRNMKNLRKNEGRLLTWILTFLMKKMPSGCFEML